MSSKKVGEYILEQPIGKGSFSRVFEGRKQGSAQRYAIKMIPNLQQNEKPMMELIEKEIEILRKIEHPNIVKLIDIKRTKNNYYLVFEYCEKGDLEKYVYRYYKKGMPEKTAQKLMFEMADAVKTLHEQNIVHRDIKLANILLTKNFVAKLSDFGFAKAQDNSSVLMKTYCGTPITMAPEIHNHFQYDFKCDIWSLGVICYQLVYNKPPFMPENGGGVQDLIDVIAKSTEVKFPKEPATGQSFKTLIRAALRKDPSKRMNIQQFFGHEWIQAGHSSVNAIDNQSTADLLRSVAVHDEMEEEEQDPGSPVIDNKEVLQTITQSDEVEKAVAKRLHDTLEEELQRMRGDFDRALSSFNKNAPKDERVLKLRNFLVFAYCQAVRHNAIVVNQRKEEFQFRVSEIKEFDEMFPMTEECEHLPPIPTLIQLLEQCSNDEKKFGKEYAVGMYRTLLYLFPLFSRFCIKAQLVVSSTSESYVRLRGVRKALLDSSFSDCATNFLTTNIKYVPSNEETVGLVQQLKLLCEQRIRDLEAELGA